MLSESEDVQLRGRQSAADGAGDGQLLAQSDRSLQEAGQGQELQGE